MALVTRLVQSREEDTVVRRHGGLQLHYEEREGTDLCTLVTATGPQGMVWSCVKEVSGCILEESSLQEVGQALEQVSQCNGQGTKPVGLQKVTEECFQK